ncbi:MAG: 4-amino-4-deoxy-L-arabinose transferase and related glycosyltransferase of family-like protein [Myxococcales bacterium]|nr:4-amino-4-deoxy-L-arabinose transferase and related glycosyltransferase of family-like protein [Myxococcales bacterium]
MSRPRSLIRWWGAVPLTLVIGLFALRACIHVEPRARLRVVAPAVSDPPGAIAQAGSLAIARGGPVIIGFLSEQPAELTVAGRVLRGAGVVKERVVVPAGPIAIRFAAPPGARLVWSPVGRRGDPEYVPTSSVSPEDPDRATFDGAGAAVGDGLIALCLLLTLVATILMLARHRLAKVPRETWIALAAVFVLALIVRLIDLGGFGATWDEDVNWASGRNYVTNLLSLDFSVSAWRWNYEHPPVMKLLDGIGAQLADGYGPARAMSAIWISLGCALLIPIGKRLYNLRVGVLAATIAALLPPLVAHGQIVGHESPTVLWFSLGTLLALCVHDDLAEAANPRRTLYTRLAVVGLVIGIAIASRFVSGLLGPLCVVIVVVNAPPAWRRATVVGIPLMVVATVLTFYAVWPRLWAHPFEAMSSSLARLSTPHATEPFLGAITNRPPSYYFVVYLFATLPIGVLAAVLVGMVRSFLASHRSALILAAWFVIPLVVAASPVRQDGVRYVMPCLTALAMCAALGLDAIALRLERRAPRFRRTFLALSAAIGIYLAVTLVRVHPYYLDYFGEQVGGAGTVAQRKWFETAWWGEGVDRAVAYVNEHAALGAKLHRECIEVAHLTWFREDLWSSTVKRPQDAAWIVVYAPMLRSCPVPPDARKVFEVTVDGAVLAAVYARP